MAPFLHWDVLGFFSVGFHPGSLRLRDASGMLWDALGFFGILWDSWLRSHEIKVISDQTRWKWGWVEGSSDGQQQEQQQQLLLPPQHRTVPLLFFWTGAPFSNRWIVIHFFFGPSFSRWKLEQKYLPFDFSYKSKPIEDINSGLN